MVDKNVKYILDTIQKPKFLTHTVILTITLFTCYVIYYSLQNKTLSINALGSIISITIGSLIGTFGGIKLFKYASK